MAREGIPEGTLKNWLGRGGIEKVHLSRHLHPYSQVSAPSTFQGKVVLAYQGQAKSRYPEKDTDYPQREGVD